MKSGRPAGEREGKHRKTSDIHLTAAMEQTIPKRQVALIAIIRAEQRPWVWWGQSSSGGGGNVASEDPGQRVRVGLRSLQGTFPQNRKADLRWGLSFRPQLSSPSVHREGHMLRTSPGYGARVQDTLVGEGLGR